MTTPLHKPVARLCATSMIRYRGKYRPLIVTLLPGDVIEMRVQGTRYRMVVPVGHAWSVGCKLAARQAMAERAERRKKRKS